MSSISTKSTVEQQKVLRVFELAINEESGDDLLGLGCAIEIQTDLAERCGLPLERVLALFVQKCGRETTKQALLARREANVRWAKALPSLFEAMPALFQANARA